MKNEKVNLWICNHANKCESNICGGKIPHKRKITPGEEWCDIDQPCYAVNKYVRCVPYNRNEQFQEVIKPIIQWMNNNCHPHTTILVTVTDAELLEGEFGFETHEFLKD